MTLAQIMTLALRQLGEDEADIAEFRGDFMLYANMGYDIAMDMYKPRDTLQLAADRGAVYIDGMDIRRVIAVMDEDDRDIPWSLDRDGAALRVDPRHERVIVLHEAGHMPLKTETDEPRIPLHAHAALADYICYRHLMTGNMAKQQRAQSYYNMFLQQIHRIRPQGTGSVTQMRNLYAATDIRR